MARGNGCEGEGAICAATPRSAQPVQAAAFAAQLLDGEARRIMAGPHHDRAVDCYELDAAEASDEARTQVERALAAIDAVHPFFAQPLIPLVLKPGTDQTLGGTGVGGYAHWRGVPLSVDISSDSPSPGLSTLHEIGHQLDQQVFAPIASAEQWGSDLDPLLDEWREAVMASRGYSTLVLNCERSIETMDPELVLYAISLKEAFARSYAQWIATRSDDDELHAELDVTLDRESEPGMIAWQWQADDFEPIAAAFDDAFAAWGAFTDELASVA